MKCRNCGTEIADKALICYRCGEATTAPRIQPPPPPRERGPWALIVAMLVLVAAAAFGLPLLEPGTPRLAGWVAVALTTALAVWTLRPRRRQRLKR
jgi:hypothetical protein